MKRLLSTVLLACFVLGAWAQNKTKMTEEEKKEVEIQVKYEGYIKLEEAQVEKFKKLEEMQIPEDIDYESIQVLSNITISGLIYGNPGTIGQASRISGVTYNDISLLIAVIKNKRY